MPIHFGVVARGTTILAKYANCAGNFTEVVEQVLGKISPGNSKLTYSHGSYLFHFICEKRIIFLCITDDDYERSKAFSYLNEIKRRFTSQYGDRAQTALPYAMNSEFSHTLATHMRAIDNPVNKPTSGDSKVRRAQDQVDELRGIMVRNIDDIANRGEHLELLIDKTDDLNVNSVSFRKQSSNLARSLWWKNVKILIVIIVIVIILLYIIVSIACGGLGWQRCVKK